MNQQDTQKAANFLSLLLKSNLSPAEAEAQRILREALNEEMAARKADTSNTTPSGSSSDEPGPAPSSPA